MKYYEWWGEMVSVDIRFPARHFESWWMVEGSPVANWEEHLLATYSSDDVLSCNFGLARNSWPIFSHSMRMFLESYAPGLIQFLPFRLQRPDGTGEVANYCVGQFLRLVDCLDRNQTRVRNNWEPINASGDFDTLRPIVLSHSLIGEEKLFRIKGECGSIVIREDLKLSIEHNGFKAQRFDLLECTDN